ncbi:hypothetical protein CDL12_27725 [Handroanthus impetiginosus]|uniref:B box-type domain-containing protein n=1 Tax=Handroanthus impetiginosus TaxID=429701 RepID=A0A2G9G385_9LAMI|nr:hypothetical protein CDL12_27725 [Handroanthus impetiginosus]
MSTASKKVMEQIDRVVPQHGVFPKWVGGLLEKTFFDKCPTHDLQKNELNRYCISCDASTCRYCVKDGNHDDHKILTIYRHIYQDVVHLNEIEKHIDCEKIQPYKCNKKWVLSLTPLPHNGSGSLIEGDGACCVCRRKLTDPERFRFCSIACKVEAILVRMGSIHPPAPGVGTSESKVEVEQIEKKEEVEQTKNKKGRKRSRKGVPRRAPLF